MTAKFQIMDSMISSWRESYKHQSIHSTVEIKNVWSLVAWFLLLTFHRYGKCTVATHTCSTHGVISNECSAWVADYFVSTEVITWVMYNECWLNSCGALIRPVWVVGNECDYPGNHMSAKLECDYRFAKYKGYSTLTGIITMMWWSCISMITSSRFLPE
jgi:hypothetical protein